MEVKREDVPFFPSGSSSFKNFQTRIGKISRTANDHKRLLVAYDRLNSTKLLRSELNEVVHLAALDQQAAMNATFSMTLF